MFCLQFQKSYQQWSGMEVIITTTCVVFSFSFSKEFIHLKFVGRKKNHLIHLANPQSRLVGIIVFAHFVRPSVRPHFSNLAKQNNRKQCSLLARQWVWPSGSLMTPVLFLLCRKTDQKGSQFKGCLVYDIHFVVRGSATNLEWNL